MIYRRFIHRSRKRAGCPPVRGYPRVRRRPVSVPVRFESFSGWAVLFLDPLVRFARLDRSRALELRFPSVATFPNSSGKRRYPSCKMLGDHFLDRLQVDSRGDREDEKDWPLFRVSTFPWHERENDIPPRCLLSCKQPERRAHRPETRIGVSVNASITSVCASILFSRKCEFVNFVSPLLSPAVSHNILRKIDIRQLKNREFFSLATFYCFRSKVNFIQSLIIKFSY